MVLFSSSVSSRSGNDVDVKTRIVHWHDQFRSVPDESRSRSTRFVDISLFCLNQFF